MSDRVGHKQCLVRRSCSTVEFYPGMEAEGVTEGENDDNGICQIEMKVNETDKEETGEMNH